MVSWTRMGQEILWCHYGIVVELLKEKQARRGRALAQVAGLWLSPRGLKDDGEKKHCLSLCTHYALSWDAYWRLAPDFFLQARKKKKKIAMHQFTLQYIASYYWGH